MYAFISRLVFFSPNNLFNIFTEHSTHFTQTFSIKILSLKYFLPSSVNKLHPNNSLQLVVLFIF